MIKVSLLVFYICASLSLQQVFDEQFFKHSFLHPDFSSEPEDLQKFIDSDIREISHKHTLEKSGKNMLFYNNYNENCTV